jgi:hypothetical protein
MDVPTAKHLVTVEQSLRLHPATQALYRKRRQQVGDEQWLLEDDIQCAIMEWHGLDPTLSALNAYREAIGRFVHEPSVRESAFFLRLNIMQAGAAIGSLVPSNIPLIDLNSEAHTLGMWMDVAADRRRPLVILAGSLT